MASTNKFKKILRHIMLAQVASDGGKYNDEIDFISYPAWLAGYDVKDRHIMEAIKLINTTKKSGIYYYVTRGGFTPYLVYFNFKLNGKRYQISFHSYGGGGGGGVGAFMGKTQCATSWDRKDSRDSALAIWDYLHDSPNCC